MRAVAQFLRNFLICYSLLQSAECGCLQSFVGGFIARSHGHSSCLRDCAARHRAVAPSAYLAWAPGAHAKWLEWCGGGCCSVCRGFARRTWFPRSLPLHCLRRHEAVHCSILRQRVSTSATVPSAGTTHIPGMHCSSAILISLCVLVCVPCCVCLVWRKFFVVCTAWCCAIPRSILWNPTATATV
jgi:hypothetical protein